MTIQRPSIASKNFKQKAQIPTAVVYNVLQSQPYAYISYLVF